MNYFVYCCVWYLLRVQPGRCTYLLHSYPIDQNLVLCSLAVWEIGKGPQVEQLALIKQPFFFFFNHISFLLVGAVNHMNDFLMMFVDYLLI